MRMDGGCAHWQLAVAEPVTHPRPLNKSAIINRFSEERRFFGSGYSGGR